MKIFRRFAALCTGQVLLCAALFAQSSPVKFADQRDIVESDSFAAEKAKRALDAGMPTLAQSITQKILASQSFENKDAVRLILIDALINLGNFDAALSEISNLEKRNSQEVLLREAFAMSMAGLKDKAAQILVKISPDKLGKKFKPWFYITRGLMRFDSGDFKNALSDFSEAGSLSDSELVKNQAEVLSDLCKLSGELNAADLESLARELQLKNSLFLGMESGGQFAKLYAIVLDRLGRKDEALQVISDTLDIALITDSDRDELAIISANVEPSRERKRLMLTELLKRTRSPKITEQAIYLLRNAYETDRLEYAAVLQDILKNGSPLVRDRILLELSYDALRRNNLDGVVTNAQELLKEYPASAFVPNAYGVLAWAAFSNIGGKAPEYRLAARYFNSLASYQKSAKEADFIKMLAADCYFLDRDYETAAAMYKPLLLSELESSWKGGVFVRAVESLLNLGDVDEAVGLADDIYKRVKIDANDVWNAEWAIASSYKDSGNLKAAVARIDSLVANPDLKKSNSDLYARMLWLQTRLAESMGEYEKTLSLADNLLGAIKSGKLKVSQATADSVSSSALLIKARTLASMSRLEGEGGAFAVYELLRKTYPRSDAAQVSYLYEARLYATKGAYAQAQQLCKKLADLFPESPYADIALYDAALYSRKLGLESDYREALALLNRLVDNYPNSSKVFFAKIAQAEILRLMGDFANAGAIYRSVVNSFENHPQVRVAMMGLGDCYLAQSGKYSDAASTFEKLYYMPAMPSDAKAEAAFKWGFALSLSGRKREATEVWWISANDFLKALDSQNKRTSQLEGKEKYWIARTLLELAKTFENSGDKASAASAYELLVAYDLPGASVAKSKLTSNSKR